MNGLSITGVVENNLDRVITETKADRGLEGGAAHAATGRAG
jgi:hypothetical protein